jgi:hypothetical protein
MQASWSNPFAPAIGFTKSNSTVTAPSLRGGDQTRIFSRNENGKDLQDLPLEERKAKLEVLLKKPPGLLRYSVSSTHKIEERFSDRCRHPPVIFPTLSFRQISIRTLPGLIAELKYTLSLYHRIE